MVLRFLVWAFPYSADQQAGGRAVLLIISFPFPGYGETGNSHTWRIHAKRILVHTQRTVGLDSSASSALATDMATGSK